MASGARCSGGGKLSGSRAQPMHHAIESSARVRDRVTNPDCSAGGGASRERRGKPELRSDAQGGAFLENGRYAGNRSLTVAARAGGAVESIGDATVRGRFLDLPLGTQTTHAGGRADAGLWRSRGGRGWRLSQWEPRP